MIIRYSIKTLLRSRGKTALFLILIFILTLLLGLELSVLQTVEAYLADCDKAYTTSAVLTYMGADYPDETVYDASMGEMLRSFDFTAIAEDSAVQVYDASTRALGYADGFTRRDSLVYDKDLAVLVLSGAHLQSVNSYYQCTVAETLYSYWDMDGKILYFDPVEEIELEPDHYYVVAGTFFSARTSQLYFRAVGFSNAASEAAGVSISVSDAVMDVTLPDGGWNVPEENVFSQIAQTECILNSALNLQATNCLETLLPFQQGQMWMEEGRSFTQEEYDSGAQVCVITQRLAKELNVRLGDSVSLRVATMDGAPAYGSYWAGTGFQEEKEFTVVGITNALTEQNHCIFVPRLSVQIPENRIGYTIATILLNNADAAAFYERWSSSLPERVRMTVYDQGYAAAAEPFREVLRLAQLVTAICALVCIGVLALFGYLFVYRQRDTAETMYRLGTGRRRIRLYFLSGAGMVALLAAVVGGIGGWLLSGKLGALIQRLAAGMEQQDYRYSDANLSAAQTAEFVASRDALPFVLAAAAVAVLAAVSCLVFLHGAMQKPRGRKSRSGRRPMRATQSSVMRPGAGKWAVLSMRRGGARTVLAAAVCFLAVIFLAQLASSAAGYDLRLQELRENTSIAGAMTDLTGSQSGTLLVGGNDLNLLARSGMISEIHASKAFQMNYQGVLDENGELQLDPNRIVVPGNSEFAKETFQALVAKGPRLIYTNCLAAAPEFYYADTVKTAFLDGWDESALASSFGDGPCPCMVSTDMLQEKGLQLGDTIVVTCYKEEQEDLQLLIIGSFERQGSKNNIYCALDGYFPEEWFAIGSDHMQYSVLYQSTFDAVSFTLDKASNLEALKQLLEDAGLSEAVHPQGRRTFVVLEDRAYLSAVGTLKQQQRHAAVLYPFLYVLAGCAACAAAYLMTLGRKREFAILRSLGTPRLRTAAGFFLEQIVLSIFGAGVGILLMAASGGLTRLGAILSCVLVAAWCLGAAGALLQMNAVPVFEVLHEEE